MNSDERGSFTNPVWTVGDYPSGCCGLLLLPFILPFILLAAVLKNIAGSRSRRTTSGVSTLDDDPVATGQDGRPEQASVTTYVILSCAVVLLILGICHQILT